MIGDDLHVGTPNIHARAKRSATARFRARRCDRARRVGWMVGAYVAWAIGIAVILFPILWAVTESIKSPIDVASKPPFWFGSPYFKNYQIAVSSYGFGGSLLNSVIATLVSLGVGLLLGIPAAYGIVRAKGRVPRVAIAWAWILRITPSIIILIPFFVLYQQLNTPSRLALIILFSIVSLALITTGLTTFFANVPFEIEEAAAVDGARSFTILMRIIIPITVPGIVATSVLAFVLTWGDLLMALIITNQETATAPIAVLSFIRGSVGIEWGPLTAAVTIIMFPVIIFGLVFHRYLVAGMSGGAVK